MIQLSGASGVNSPVGKIKVMIIADHPIMRDGLRFAVQNELDMRIVAEVAATAEALVQLPRCDPDVILVDLQSPLDAGLRAVRALREAVITIPIVLLMTFPVRRKGRDRSQLELVFPLSKTASSEQIISQLRNVSRR